jgi:hypothetical protein
VLGVRVRDPDPHKGKKALELGTGNWELGTRFTAGGKKIERAVTLVML